MYRVIKTQSRADGYVRVYMYGGRHIGMDHRQEKDERGVEAETHKTKISAKTPTKNMF